MKFFIFLFSFFIFFAGCEKTPDAKRLKRREVLYKFEESENSCTDLWGRGAIKNSTPENVMESLKRSYKDLGYISINGETLLWELPWPFEDINEKVTIEEKNGTVLITGKKEMSRLKLSAYSLEKDITVLKVEGRVCKDIPSFIKENILSSCIKKVVKTVRDNIE